MPLTNEQTKSLGSILTDVGPSTIAIICLAVLFWFSTEQQAEILEAQTRQHIKHQELIQHAFGRWADASERSAIAMEKLADLHQQNTAQNENLKSMLAERDKMDKLILEELRYIRSRVDQIPTK